MDWAGSLFLEGHKVVKTINTWLTFVSTCRNWATLISMRRERYSSSPAMASRSFMQTHWTRTEGQHRMLC